MPQLYPKEFRDDVIQVALNRDPKIAQIAKDFGIHGGTLNKWIRQAEIDTGNKPGKSTDESAELRERRRRTRLLDSEATYKLTGRVLKLSLQPYYRWLAAPVPEADVIEAYRANALFDAHRDDPEFGYRYLADESEASGQPMAVRTAWRLCSSNAWFSASVKGRGKNGKNPGPPVYHSGFIPLATSRSFGWTV